MYHNIWQRGVAMCLRQWWLNPTVGNAKRRRVRTVNTVLYLVSCVVFFFNISCVAFPCELHSISCFAFCCIVFHCVFVFYIMCVVFCIMWVNAEEAVDKNGQAAKDRKVTNEERHGMRKSREPNILTSKTNAFNQWDKYLIQEDKYF